MSIYYFNFHAILGAEFLGKNGVKLNCQTILRLNAKQSQQYL